MLGVGGVTVGGGAGGGLALSGGFGDSNSAQPQTAKISAIPRRLRESFGAIRRPQPCVPLCRSWRQPTRRCADSSHSRKEAVFRLARNVTGFAAWNIGSD